MEKRKVATIFDNVFLVIGIWLISYLWTRYYVMNLLFALITASGISLFIIILIDLKRKKDRLKRKKQKHIDSIMNQFLFGGKDFSVDFLFSGLKTKFGTNLTNSDQSISNNTPQPQKIGAMVLYKGSALFTSFSPTPVSLDFVIDCYVEAKKADAKRLIILSIHGCDRTCKSSINTLPDMKIDVFDKNKSYDFLGWLGSFPKVTIVPAAHKPSLKSLLKGAFSPAKFKHYLAISMVLMLSSYFVSYPIYYIAFASITLTLAILSKLDIVKKLNNQKNNKA